MGLVKRTYTDNVTVITAENLNDIQDEIILNGTNIGDLTELETTDKTDLVSSINEVKGDIPSVPSPSNASPQMDGTASAGVSNDYSRADHVHPNDTTKANAEDVGEMSELPNLGDYVEVQIDIGEATQGGLTGTVGNTISRTVTTNYYYYTIPISDTSARYKVKVGKGTSSTYQNYIFVCDSNDSVIAVYAHPESTQKWETVEFSVPSNAANIYALSIKELYTQVTAYKVFFEHGTIVDYINDLYNTSLKGKNLLVLGDSIAFGSGNPVPNEITGSSCTGVGEIIAEKYGMNCVKRAVGGATVAVYAGSTNNIVVQAEYAIANIASVDYILMDGYTNDIAIGSLVKGNISSGYSAVYDTSTFCGAWEYIISSLKAKYPNAKIVYFLPHNMATRTIALQTEYTDLIKELCKKWSIEVADVYGKSNMLTWLTQYMQYTDNGSGTADGTHPNADGYNKFYLPIIENCMLHI